MKKIRFLHIVQDERFFEQTRKLFEKDENVCSEYASFCWTRKKRIINNEGLLTVYYKSKDFIRRLMQDDYDVMYLHSLHFSIIRFLKYVPSDKIVIWWAWGGDIYDGQLFGLKSYIHIESMKPITERVVNRELSIRRIMRYGSKVILSLPFSYYRKQALKRIDYFQPVIDIDYSLMKRFTNLNAMEYYPTYWSNFYTGTEICKNKMNDGSILLGNSASPAQNHLDVWEIIKQYVPPNRLVLLPLSYGTPGYGNVIKDRMIDQQHNIRVLDKFLPPNEYFELINDCSYAVFGSIRQHAMGNIYNALRSGLKIFLFKDSVIYEYLKNRGYIVFSIEDFSEDSLKIPLSVEEQRNNLSAMKSELEEYRGKSKLALENIRNQVLNHKMSYECFSDS